MNEEENSKVKEEVTEPTLCGSLNEEPEKKYTVRHNKADVTLTLGELLKTAEKGLDYDRIRPSHDFVKELANKNGESDVSRFIAKMKTDGAAAADGCPSNQEEAETLAANESELIKKEYPQYFKDGSAELPEDAKRLKTMGINAIDALRLSDLAHMREECDRLTARLGAEKANRENAFAAVGSLAGGECSEKSYYSSKEWDKLSKKQQEKFIRSGKIYEFMKKWSGK